MIERLAACININETKLLSYYHNREFLVGQAPQLVKATSTYCVDGRLKIEQNDTIAIIDGRPELSFLKGQNQRTFEIGTFPRNILEVLRFNRHGTLNTISRPVHGSLKHAAHGAAFGPTWGSPSYLDSSYGENVQMRQKSTEHVSKNHRQQRTVSEHFAKEKKPSASKQFSYNKLINEQRMQHDKQQAIINRPKPARPPVPHVQPQEGILIDLSPEEIRSMNITLQQQANQVGRPTTSCILDDPIEVPTEGFEFQVEEQFPMPIPPPYPMPPQYLNTTAINDPFDTTHIIPPVDGFYSNSTAVQHRAAEPIYNNNLSRYSANNTSEQLNELLNASLVSLSLASGNQNDNINGQPVTPKKMEKQMLSEQLTGAKDSNQVKLNLEQMMNMTVPMTTATTAARNYDPFSPIQTNQTFVNNNYSNAYSNPSASEPTSIHCDANIYNSVASESVYGENFYDAVQPQTPSVIYDSTASMYSVQQQQAIYDEVSAYDELRWQPQVAALRPAPAPPSQSTYLSQQQINRRLEKINQQQGVIAELMKKLSMDNMTEDEAKSALEIAHWNQDLATRHFKIERLSK